MLPVGCGAHEMPDKKRLARIGSVRAILFDKDGTLVDFQRTFGPAVDETMRRLAGQDATAYERLARASRFVEKEQLLLPDSPLIGEPTSIYGVQWAAALRRQPDLELFEQIDRLLREATTAH